MRGHVMVMVNAIMLALAAAFTGSITFTLTRRISWSGLAALFALAYVYSLYYMQWSETLYLVFQMPAVLALIAYFDSRRIRWLGVAGVFMSLTWLTRYAGAGIVLPAIGLVFIASHPTWKDRLIATTLFATVSGLGMAIWYGYIFTTSDTVIFNHVQTAEKLATNWDWFYLHLKRITGSREALFGVLVILVVSLLWTVLSARKPGPRRTWIDHIRAIQDALTSGPGVLLSLSAVYTAMIFVSATTSNVTMDLRMIVLAFPLLTAATITLLSRIVGRSRLADAALLTGCGLLSYFAVTGLDSEQSLLVFGVRR